MSSYVLKVDESIAMGRVLLDYIKSFSKVNDCVEIIPQKNKPYNPEFVKKIQNNANSGKYEIIETEDLWK